MNFDKDSISDKPLKNVARILSLFFLIGISMSIPLWTPIRVIPLLPFFQIPFSIPNILNWSVFVIAVTALSCYLISLKRTFLLIFLGCLVIFLVQDQLRWQPWVYMYSLMLIPFSFSKKPTEDQLRIFLQIVIITVYLWGGIHKIHPNFIKSTFASIFGTCFYFLEEHTINKYLFIGYLAPITEIAIGIFLFVPKLRSTGVQLTLLLHIFIIAYLGPWGIDFNTIVLPWNLAMIILVFLLFSEKRPIIWRMMFTRRTHRYFPMVLFFVCFMPALSNFNLWDHYLSFSLYSNKAPHFYIASDYNSFGAFNSTTELFIKKTAPSQGNGYVDVNAWCMSVLNVPFYPEERVFQQLSTHFCKSDPNPDKLLFIINQPTFNSEVITSFNCKYE